MTTEEKLTQIVKKFIQEQDIGCPETIYQCDSVILNALPFIEELIEVVGYYESKETD